MGEVPDTVWLQDPFQPGYGVNGEFMLYESFGQYRQNRDVAESMQERIPTLKVKESGHYGAGGDVHIIENKAGQQYAFFGKESMEWFQRRLEFPPSIEAWTDSGQLYSIANMMTAFVEKGIPPERIIPVGANETGKTYGEALKALTPAQRATFTPTQLAFLESHAELLLPDDNMDSDDYHLDLRFHFVANDQGGITAMYSKPKDEGEIPQRNAEIEALKKMGITEFVELPAEHRESSASKPLGSFLNYTNVQTLIDTNDPNNPSDDVRRVLIPTEATDPKQLTDNDKKALAAFQQAYPPGTQFMMSGLGIADTQNDMGGLHCSAQYLPIELKPRAK